PAPHLVRVALLRPPARLLLHPDPAVEQQLVAEVVGDALECVEARPDGDLALHPGDRRLAGADAHGDVLLDHLRLEPHLEDHHGDLADDLLAREARLERVEPFREGRLRHPHLRHRGARYRIARRFAPEWPWPGSWSRSDMLALVAAGILFGGVGGGLAGTPTQ